VSLLVILPTYDERANVAPMVSAIRGLGGSCGILIVDDASPDGTGLIADALAHEDPQRVQVLRNKVRLGLAESRRAAFQHALLRDDWRHAVLMDCDFSHDPGRIPALIAALSDADVAIGSRCVPGGGEEGRGFYRRWLTHSANRIAARLLASCGVRDMTAGFFAFRREAMASILPHLRRCRGFASSMELKWVASHLGLRLTEVPVLFRARRAGSSKLSLGILCEALYQVLAMSCRSPRLTSASGPKFAPASSTSVAEVQRR
jgi:dolichol-phosphate mannosyltransferase